VIVKTESGEEATLEWDRVRCFEKEVAVMFLSQVKECKETKVVSVVSKEKSKPRPLALNTVELMRVASSGNLLIIIIKFTGDILSMKTLLFHRFGYGPSSCNADC